MSLSLRNYLLISFLLGALAVPWGWRLWQDRSSAAVLAEIRPGMTHSEVSQVIPLSLDDTFYVLDGGSLSVDVAINTEHVIQIRFAPETAAAAVTPLEDWVLIDSRLASLRP